MKTRFIGLILSLFWFTLLNGQKLGDYYLGIPIDNSENCRLRFLSSSSVEMSNVPRHMGRIFSKVLSYTSNDTVIEISTNELTLNDSLSLTTFKLDYLVRPTIKLKKIKGGFIDNDNSLIFVRSKDFDHNPDIAYIIDGKLYFQDVGFTDGYGIIKRRPKVNKSLQKELKDVNKDNCTIESVKGIIAYRRFGIKTVFGALVITRNH